MSKNTLFLLLILILVASCSPKKPTPCVEADVYSVIREKKMTDLIIVNSNELRFKHSSKKNFPTFEDDYCACLWSNKLASLEDSLQTHRLSNYRNIRETNKFGLALSYVLPSLILFSLVLVPIGAVMLFREKGISDTQRLTYLILILFVPVVGFVIYMAQRKGRIR
jgi:hypothetical protein